MNQVLKADIDRLTTHFAPDAELAGKTLLITGATGLLGRTLIHCVQAWNRQRAEKTQILALVRDRKAAEALFEATDDLRFVEGDMAHLDALATRSFDYVVHLAAPTSSKYFCSHPVETIQTIVMGTDRLLQMALRQRVSAFVYLSSMEAYGAVSNDERPLRESDLGFVDLQSVRSSYPEGKRMAENLCLAYCREYGLPVRMVRLCQTFGPDAPQTDCRVTTTFARNIVAGTDLVLKSRGEAASDHCYTLDAVTAILLILTRGTAGETYNVASPDTYCTIREMAEYMVRHFGRGSKVVMDVDSDAPFPPPTRLRLDISKLSALGWKPLFAPYTMYERLIKSLE